jgi:hypothetical protein
LRAVPEMRFSSMSISPLAPLQPGGPTNVQSPKRRPDNIGRLRGGVARA